jgi:hypothetical protein
MKEANNIEWIRVDVIEDNKIENASVYHKGLS